MNRDSLVYRVAIGLLGIDANSTPISPPIAAGYSLSRRVVAGLLGVRLPTAGYSQRLQGVSGADAEAMRRPAAVERQVSIRPRGIAGNVRTSIKLCLFIACVAIFLFDSSEWLGRWSLAPRFAGLAFVFYVSQLQAARTSKTRIRQPYYRSPLLQVPQVRARQLLQESREATWISTGHAEVFTRAILYPSEFQPRIVEAYELDQRFMRRKVSVEIQIPDRLMQSADRGSDPDGDEPTILYPIMVSSKGVLQDNFVIWGPDGSQLSTLSYREYLRVAARAFHFLLAAAYNELPDAELPTYAVDLELAAIWEIIKGSDGRNEMTSGSDVLQSLHSLRADKQAIRMVEQFVALLSTHYAIVAVVPVPKNGRFTITYESTLVPERRQKANVRLKSLLARFRRKTCSLNADSDSSRAWSADLRLSLDKAWECQSYHVMVHCPEGFYVARQELEVPDGYLKRIAPGAPTPPYVRFRRPGQSYAHFYARFMPPPKGALPDIRYSGAMQAENIPHLLLDFSEVPPGSVCYAALSAIATSVLIWLTGYGLQHSVGALSGTDTLALLLFFSAVVASWLGLIKAVSRWSGRMLAVRLSSGCTALTSSLAIVLYLLYHTSPVSDEVIHGSHRETFRLALLGITPWPWMLLLLVALLNASYGSYRWWTNSWQFRYLTAHDDAGERTTLDGADSG